MREIAGHAPGPRAGVIGLVAGSLALSGVIPFSGYFSKEAVLAALGRARRDGGAGAGLRSARG